MTDDMQRLREALAEVMRGPGRVADHADAILVLLAEEGWVVPQSPDGTSRSAAGRSTPVGERTATPQAEVEALRACVMRLTEGHDAQMMGAEGLWFHPTLTPEPMTEAEVCVMRETMAGG